MQLFNLRWRGGACGGGPAPTDHWLHHGLHHGQPTTLAEIISVHFQHVLTSRFGITEHWTTVITARHLTLVDCPDVFVKVLHIRNHLPTDVACRFVGVTWNKREKPSSLATSSAAQSTPPLLWLLGSTSAPLVKTECLCTSTGMYEWDDGLHGRQRQ